MMRIVMSALSVPVTVAITSMAMVFASLAFGLGTLNQATNETPDRS